MAFVIIPEKSRGLSMLYIAICDDESVEVEYLTALTREWAKASGTAVSVASYASAEQFLLSVAAPPDILLLDIQMGEMDGMALARRIRRDNGYTQIIFITGLTEFMADGYEVEALHYIVKPIHRERLFSLLTKAAERLGKREETLLVQTRDDSVRILHKDILYIEAFAHYVLIALTGSDFETRSAVETRNVIGPRSAVESRAKISEMEAALKNGFVRCHRSYLVGLRHVNRIGKTKIILDGGKVIPLSRRLYNEVNRAFIAFHTSGRRPDGGMA